MQPVSVISMPHNFRDVLYDKSGPGQGPQFTVEDGTDDEPDRGPSAYGQEWVELPIPMPEVLQLATDQTGRVIAAWCDDKQVRWKDLDIVVTGVEQYNQDCASREDDI